MGRAGGTVHTALALAQRWHCGSLGSQIHLSFCPRQRSQAAFCEFALAMLVVTVVALKFSAFNWVQTARSIRCSRPFEAKSALSSKMLMLGGGEGCIVICT